MNKDQIRQNRIKSLFEYAMSLRFKEGITIEKIMALTLTRAEFNVSTKTAKEYLKEVQARIDKLR